MAPTAWSILSSVRLTGVIQGLQDTRQIPDDLLFLNRTAIVPAADNEIMARVNGYVTIADIIADDQRAVVYTPDTFTLEQTTIPNIKHGRPMTQAMINALQSMLGGSVGDGGFFSDYESRVLDALLLGVRQRIEALLVAMMLDGLSYDRLGIKMTNLSWGMPSDLKVTSAVDWSTAASATPVNDLWSIRRTARVRYGTDYNRATMSTTAFMYMIATAEFQAKARTFLAPNVSYVNLTLADLESQRLLAQNVLGLQIELYDSRYWYQTTAGPLSSEPYLPINKVVLTNTADDNDSSAWDFANGVTTESIVAGMVDSPTIGGFGGPTRGPIAYATAESDLNPPQITMWGVARGFPRKHRLQSSAALTAGTGWSDSIAVGAPF